MPNITGQFLSRSASVNSANSYVSWDGQGAFQTRNNVTSGTAAAITVDQSQQFTSDAVSIDASKSNSIYGNSNTVQPPAVKLLPCIRALS